MSCSCDHEKDKNLAKFVEDFYPEIKEAYNRQKKMQKFDVCYSKTGFPYVKFDGTKESAEKIKSLYKVDKFRMGYEYRIIGGCLYIGSFTVNMDDEDIARRNKGDEKGTYYVYRSDDFMHGVNRLSEEEFFSKYSNVLKMEN